MPEPPSSRKPARILVVDDQMSMAEMIADGLADRGYDATPMASSRDAAALLEREPLDLLVTDLRMPRIDGLGLLAVSRKADPSRPVIVMTAYSAVDTAIESIRQGAYHYMTKPFKVEELVLFVERALGESKLRREAVALRRALRSRFGLENLVGESAAMREVGDLVERVADASVPVLITGETGTGKGLVARAIHAQGARAEAPFVSVNCASLPENLLESELFGHVKGAFTGATANRVGLLEEADGGTLFLDEIGEMAPALQAKLLHVLESGTVRAVGSNKERAVDARILAATHRDLRERVTKGEFREDLLYRLDVVSIALPPLRHRRDDLPALIEHFLASAKAKHPRSPVESIAPEALERMLDHRWPGNVRELEHVMERAVLLGRSREIGVADLPATVVEGSAAPNGTAFSGDVVPLREVQRRYVAWAFERFGGRKVLTAEKLGIDFKTLSRWLDSGGESNEGR
ncbi:sigma-54 dependent transcriptional regulator [Pendulispora brunnea]|uniref:Sigma-54 dependent transcriptional regulator n=1 Tax=Pendulispora brunnea TaxID=2905690 RepID=A0ABZ2KJ94_9BACT